MPAGEATEAQEERGTMPATAIEKTTQALDDVEFSNSFVDELPGETSGSIRPRPVPGYCYSLVTPTPVSDPRLLAWSDELGVYLGLERPAERGPAVEILAWNRVSPSMKPFASRYGGHHFGGW